MPTLAMATDTGRLQVCGIKSLPVISRRSACIFAHCFCRRELWFAGIVGALNQASVGNRLTVKNQKPTWPLRGLWPLMPRRPRSELLLQGVHVGNGVAIKGWKGQRHIAHRLAQNGRNTEPHVGFAVRWNAPPRCPWLRRGV